MNGPLIYLEIFLKIKTTRNIEGWWYCCTDLGLCGGPMAPTTSIVADSFRDCANSISADTGFLFSAANVSLFRLASAPCWPV